MSNGLASRLLRFLIGEDEAVNGLLGGGQRETISGSIGRALLAHKWWASGVRLLVDGVLGQGHCAGEAAKEAARRAEEQGQ